MNPLKKEDTDLKKKKKKKNIHEREYKKNKQKKEGRYIHPWNFFLPLTNDCKGRVISEQPFIPGILVTATQLLTLYFSASNPSLDPHFSPIQSQRKGL